MKPISSMLALLAVTTIVGCAHTVSPVLPTLPSVTTAQASATDDDSTQAQQLVTQHFTEPRTHIQSVQVTAMASPHMYTFVCVYRRTEFYQLCEYEAKGQVDLSTQKITGQHRLRACLGDAPQPSPAS